MRNLWNWIIHIASGEWMLRGNANGGDVIIARSLFAALALYLIFIGLKHGLDPTRNWSFSGDALQREAHASLAVFGALFAAVYASLYARFAAQWSYLAGLYNKLLEAEVGLTGAETAAQMEAFAFWKASFIEDADDLHLSTKRIFVPAIRDWLEEAAVRQAFGEGALGSERRLKALQARLATA
jgi:hypothetical protein